VPLKSRAFPSICKDMRHFQRILGIARLLGLAALGLLPARLALARSVAIQRVDANIVPAAKVELLAATAASVTPWQSTGTQLVAACPTLRVRANVAYRLGVESAAEASYRNLAATLAGDRPGTEQVEDPTQATGRDHGAEVRQLIDFGVPRVVDAGGDAVQVVYTVLPASV